ncbi:MAG TPA: DsrE family protein [Nitrospira sp.]|nr:DsrE family protein [Nitrospira sp.]
MKRKVGFLLALPPEHQSSETVTGLAHAALDAGHEVYLYLIDEGVKNMKSQAYQDLARAGVRMFVCAYGCQQHHVPTVDVEKEFTLCGLVVLSGLIDACKPFISFT